MTPEVRAYIEYLYRVIREHGGCPNLLDYEQWQALTPAQKENP